MQDSHHAAKGCASVLTKQVCDRVLQGGQRSGYAALAEKPCHKVGHALQLAGEHIKYLSAGFTKHIHDYAAYVLQVVAQNAYHGNNAADRSNYRGCPGKQAAKAACHRPPNAAQQSGPGPGKVAQRTQGVRANAHHALCHAANLARRAADCLPHAAVRYGGDHIPGFTGHPASTVLCKPLGTAHKVCQAQALRPCNARKDFFAHTNGALAETYDLAADGGIRHIPGCRADSAKILPYWAARHSVLCHTQQSAALLCVGDLPGHARKALHKLVVGALLVGQRSTVFNAKVSTNGAVLQPLQKAAAPVAGNGTPLRPCHVGVCHCRANACGLGHIADRANGIARKLLSAGEQAAHRAQQAAAFLAAARRRAKPAALTKQQAPGSLQKIPGQRCKLHGRKGSGQSAYNLYGLFAVLADIVKELRHLGQGIVYDGANLAERTFYARHDCARHICNVRLQNIKAIHQLIYPALHGRHGHNGKVFQVRQKPLSETLPQHTKAVGNNAYAAVAVVNLRLERIVGLLTVRRYSLQPVQLVRVHIVVVQNLLCGFQVAHTEHSCKGVRAPGIVAQLFDGIAYALGLHHCIGAAVTKGLHRLCYRGTRFQHFHVQGVQGSTHIVGVAHNARQACKACVQFCLRYIQRSRRARNFLYAVCQLRHGCLSKSDSLKTQVSYILHLFGAGVTVGFCDRRQCINGVYHFCVTSLCRFRGNFQYCGAVRRILERTDNLVKAVGKVGCGNARFHAYAHNIVGQLVGSRVYGLFRANQQCFYTAHTLFKRCGALVRGSNRAHRCGGNCTHCGKANGSYCA